VLKNANLGKIEVASKGTLRVEDSLDKRGDILQKKPKEENVQKRVSEERVSITKESNGRMVQTRPLGIKIPTPGRSVGEMKRVE